ncbi:tRNA uridine-5-carboxymethylaminomethyl(34) synthesis GTPase MnmE [Candidatus Babeliales bacterium]|nr:tRNA uridine-5-carboxymethylaminomethyl(34) synthesis GTPase MnmE [Candidatus Babeliales bacterium]
MATCRLKLLTNDQGPIVALCTSRGSGAIAVLRICGTDAIKIVDKFAKISSGKNLSECNSHTIHHGYVINSNNPKNVIDEVLFFLMRSPKTFTGQDTVEINCHNNLFIIERIIELAILSGARLAERGEFTKRAFLNKKIDLVQAESINDLINAQTEFVLKKSMSQLSGSLSYFLQEIELCITKLLALIEGSFEFFEEEQKDLDLDNLIRENIKKLCEKLDYIKSNFKQQQRIKNGIKICILGWVNSGKSTLFNALVKNDRAIVTKIEGTTRDSIEYSLYKNGNFWSFIDTAGIRDTNDFIEKKGIDRSLNQAEYADIILLIFDSSIFLNNQKIEVYKKIFEKYKDKIILVASKIDIEDKESLNNLLFIDHKKFVKVSGLKKIGIDILEDEIEKSIQDLFLKLKSPFLLNCRQYNLIIQMKRDIDFIVKNYKDSLEYELIAYHLKNLLETLSQLTGKNVSERVLDSVFKQFCVGK